jgi:hypothetical protein
MIVVKWLESTDRISVPVANPARHRVHFEFQDRKPANAGILGILRDYQFSTFAEHFDFRVTCRWRFRAMLVISQTTSQEYYPAFWLCNLSWAAFGKVELQPRG